MVLYKQAYAKPFFDFNITFTEVDKEFASILFP